MPATDVVFIARDEAFSSGVSTSAPTEQVRRRRLRLPVGWQLTGLLALYPLWWLLGVAQVLSLVAAAMMALELLRRKRIYAPRGFALYLLFLCWVVIGVLLLQVNAPGTVQGPSHTRYLTFSFRLSWYIAATIVLLYIGNMRKELSSVRIVRAFGWMFVTVVGGGILGTIAPHLDFPSAIEVILPKGITAIPFIHDLVHPVVAQLNLVGGIENPRASAPFPYTNAWAVNLALTLPFFIAAWFGPQAAWRRKVGPFILVVALIPVIVTVNRGLWIALIVVALLTAVRSAASGHLRSLMGVLAGAGVVAVLLVMTPLGATVQHRIDNGYSDEGRTNLSESSVTTVVKTSPFVGLGTTRDVQGSFTSIAGASTSACPLCAPPALGTQGHLWLVTFSTGIVGLLLYLGFFVYQTMRALPLRSAYVSAGLAVVIAHLATMPFYDIIGIAMFAVMGGVGLLWRAQLDVDAPVSALPDPTVGGYLSMVRSNGRIFVVLVLIGVLSAAAIESQRPPLFTSDTTILLPPDPIYPNTVDRPATLDTLAQLVTSSGVLAPAVRATGLSSRTLTKNLAISASPGTRILHISLRASSSRLASAGSRDVANALLVAREKQLTQRKDSTLKVLGAKESGLAEAVSTVDRTIASAPSKAGKQLEPVRSELVAASNSTSSDAAVVASAPLDAGTLLSPPRASRSRDQWKVGLTSGLMLALLAATAVALVRNAVGARILSGTQITTETGLPVIALVDRPAPGTTADIGVAARAVRVFAPRSCVGLGADSRTHDIAGRLDDGLQGARSRAPREQTTVIVASSRTRIREIDGLRRSLAHSGVRPVAIVVVR